MILVDTSAWIQHLRKSDTELVTFLKEQRVRACDVVIGELLLG
jgi:predicted nucleic acid-binding protein